MVHKGSLLLIASSTIWIVLIALMVLAFSWYISEMNYTTSCVCCLSCSVWHSVLLVLLARVSASLLAVSSSPPCALLLEALSLSPVSALRAWFCSACLFLPRVHRTFVVAVALL